MTTKTLTITEDAYNLLAERKLEDESFSQEIRRLFSEKPKRKLSEFAGILSDIDAESMKADIAKFRDLDMKMER